jgi:hypothetical protein
MGEGWKFWRAIKNIIFWVLIPIVIFLAHPRSEGAHIDRPLEYLDAGIRLSAANQYLHGKRPYDEIFLDYGPLLEIFQPLLAFKLFGETLAAHRKLDLILDPLGPLIIYFLALAFIRSEIFILLFTLVLLGRPDIWIPARAAPPLLSLLFMAQALKSEGEKPRLLWTGLGGFSCALAFFYSMEGGIFLGLVVLIFYFFRLIQALQLKKGASELVKEASAFGLGGLLVFIGIFLWLGHLEPFLKIPRLSAQMIFIQKDAMGKPTPPLVKPIIEMFKNPSIIFTSPQGAILRWWFPPFLYMVGLTLCLKTLFNKKVFSWPLFLLIWTGILFFLIALGRSDYEHWLKGTPTFWLSVIVGLDVLWTPLRAKVPSFRFSYLATSFGFLFLLTYSLCQLHVSLVTGTLRDWGWSHLNLIETPQLGLDRIGGLNISDEDKTFGKNIVLRLRKYAGGPGGSAYLFNDDPLFYFLADVVNPTRYSVSSWITGKMNDEVIADLDSKTPSCIMAIRQNSGLSHTPLNEKLSVYISTHYKEVDHWENFVFLQQKK